MDLLDGVSADEKQKQMEGKCNLSSSLGLLEKT